MSNIAIIGAAGASGRQIIAALKGRQVTARALVHSEAGAERVVAAGAGDAVLAELEDVDAVAGSLAGIDTIMMIPPALNPREEVLAANAIQAAQTAGVERFVYLSVLHPYTPEMAHHMRKTKVEAKLRHTDLAWTILQPAMFAQIVFLMFGSGPAGHVRVPFDVRQVFSTIDLADLAEVAAKVLCDEGHTYASYELAGDAATMQDYVATAGRLRGVELRPERIAPAEAHLPPHIAEGSQSAADMRLMFDEYDKHGLRGNSTVLSALLRRPPGSFEAVVKRSLAEAGPVTRAT